jgi:hypothetical protein
MVYRGSVKNGKVVLDDATGLAEGTKVTVRPVVARSKANGQSKANGKHRRLTLAERLASVIGKSKGLPTDASVNLDHYLSGLPKRK